MKAILAPAVTAPLTAVVAALFASTPQAIATPLEDVIAAEVLTGWRTPQGTQMAAIRLTLAEGWKTYWRAPGDGGISPEFDWDGSRNIAAARIHWPVPEVWRQDGIRSVGYHDEVVIPIEVTPRDAGTPTHMEGVLDIGVCLDICLPMQLAFSATLPEPGARSPAIAAALVDRPLSGAEAGLTAHYCDIAPDSEGLRIAATLTLPPTGGREEVVIETADPLIWVSEPVVQRQGDRLRAEARLIHAAGPGFALDRSGLRITVLGSNIAVDVAGCPAP